MYNHDLDTFRSVAETGSFSKTADALFISKVSVMYRINSLEQELGVELFERTKKGVSLTKEGAFLYDESQELISKSFRIRTQIKHLSDDVNRQIRIMVTPINPLDDFNRIWHRSPKAGLYAVILANAPSDINSEVQTKNNANYADIGFCSEAVVDDFVPTEAVFYHEYSITCAVPFSHPLAAKKRLTMKDLEGETILFPSRGFPELARRFTHEIRKTHPEIHVETVPMFYDLELFNRCAEDGRLLLSLDCWDHIHPGIKNIKVNWKWKVPYGLIYKKDARPEVLEFIAAFKEAMAMEDE